MICRISYERNGVGDVFKRIRSTRCQHLAFLGARRHLCLCLGIVHGLATMIIIVVCECLPRLIFLGGFE